MLSLILARRALGFPGSMICLMSSLVDTGAAFTKIPFSQAEEIVAEPRYETEVELADGRLVPRKLGLADIQIADVRRPALLAVGSDGENPVLGYTTLENLGFKVNPFTGRLEHARPIEFKNTVSSTSRASPPEVETAVWTFTPPTKMSVN